MLFVLYSGIGAKKSETHTIDEFLGIMRRNFVENKTFEIVNGESHATEKLKRFDLREWLEWSGARLMQTN